MIEIKNQLKISNDKLHEIKNGKGNLKKEIESISKNVELYKSKVEELNAKRDALIIQRLEAENKVYRCSEIIDDERKHQRM